MTEQQYREHPILFSEPMVNAILDGRKTQTRRVVSPQNSVVNGHKGGGYGLTQKELFAASSLDEAWVDPGPSPAGNAGPYLKVPYHAEMVTYRLYPKWARGDVIWIHGCCTRLKIIRVERLQDISVEDALAEGIEHNTMNCPRHEFFQLWNSINGELAHKDNPWVWAIEFTTVQPEG